MQRDCAHCGKPYTAKNSRSKFCSDLCRAKFAKTPKATDPAAPVSLEVYAATLATLTEAGQLETPAGMAALALARRVDHSAAESMSSLSAGVRELRATLADALKDAAPRASALDELRKRRDAKRNAG